MAEKHPKSLDWRSRAAKLERDVANLIYEGIDTPVSLSCFILLKYGETEQLVSKRIRPCDYNHMESFRDDYQAVSLLSKSSLIQTQFDRQQACREGYDKSENLCSGTNERLIALRDGLVSPLNPHVLDVIKHAQSFISSILPRLTNQELEWIEGEMSFGPGATVGVKRVVTFGRKFDLHNIDCTPEILSFGIFCLPEIWKQRVTGFTPTTYAELEFVPKNSKTDRAIEIQPTLNIYVQKGIGSWLRRSLRRFGLDLSSQEGNQELALAGSLTNELVTADLLSASDRVSHQTVRLLFSHRPDVLALLEWARVGRCKSKDGSVRSLEKFSAMGNGYTFELETLIFLSLVMGARCVCQDNQAFRVYGDDIIVSTKVWPLLSDSLKFLGFDENSEKTYGNTYFRESCGADYWNGVNVRPFFLKQKVKDSDDFNQLCYIYSNQIILYSSRIRCGNSRDSRYLRAWTTLYLAVPPHLRFRVPEGFDANGFLGSFDEARPSLRRDKEKFGWQGYFFKYRHYPAQRTDRYAYGALIAQLKSGGGNFSYGEESLRGVKLPATTQDGYALAWPHFGPWA